MNIKKSLSSLLACAILLGSSVQAQTFSPYSPEEIQDFNSQVISPVETPMGPLYPSLPPQNANPSSSIDARYISKPEGEEQAEGQGAESARPFEPIPSTITF
jgi:hypothetical protein